MITHDEAISILKLEIIKTLERAKKEHELLGLYRLQKIEAQEKRLNDITLYWVYENKIKDLEKELEELK